MIAGEAAVVFGKLPWYWAVAIFAPIFICFSVIQEKHRKQLYQEHFRGRPVLNEEEFGRHYFPPDRAEIAAKLRKILANNIKTDMSRLSPADRFIEDLRMEDLDSMSTVEFVIEVEEQFGIKIPDSAAGKITTLQQAVDYVAEASKAGANEKVK